MGGSHSGKWREAERRTEAERKRRLAKKEAKAAQEAAAAAAQAEAAQKAADPSGCRESTRKRPAQAADAPQCGECNACHCCNCEDPGAESPEVQIDGLRKVLAAAEAALTARGEQLKEVQAKAQRATSALGKRECGPEAMPPARLLEAFANTDAGVPRESTDAVQRAAQRAIKKTIDALPDGIEQCAVVLDALLKRPFVREAAAEAGIRTAADYELAEAAMMRAGEACAKIIVKKGSLTLVDSDALNTFLTFVVPEANREARQRGKAAAQAKARGEEVPLATVTDVRKWATLLKLSEGTMWRHLRQVLQKRGKLDRREELTRTRT